MGGDGIHCADAIIDVLDGFLLLFHIFSVLRPNTTAAAAEHIKKRTKFIHKY